MASRPVISVASRLAGHAGVSVQGAVRARGGALGGRINSGLGRRPRPVQGPHAVGRRQRPLALGTGSGGGRQAFPRNSATRRGRPGFGGKVAGMNRVRPVVEPGTIPDPPGWTGNRMPVRMGGVPARRGGTPAIYDDLTARVGSPRQNTRTAADVAAGGRRRTGLSRAGAMLGWGLAGAIGIGAGYSIGPNSGTGRGMTGPPQSMYGSSGGMVGGY